MSTTTVVLIAPEGRLTEEIREVVLSTSGCSCERVGRPETALLRVLQGDVGLVLAYVADAGQVQGAVDLLHEMGRARVPVPMIVVSESDDPDLVLKLMRLGIVDCLPRPLDLSRLAFLLDILTIRIRHELPNRGRSVATRPQESQSCVADFVFAGPKTHDLLKQLRMVAPLETTILFTGETGTGKTHLARVVHELSPRKKKPFLVVSCSALSTSLFESELFGHVRGAFTTADRDRTGRFAEVQDGTILLDEIDCVPLETQAKLLRVVEDRVFEPVGSTDSQALRARLIAASNRPLDEEVTAGRFRSDLYYRLKVVDFPLPPLRGHYELTQRLAKKFLADCCDRCGRPPMEMSNEALAAMEVYNWPGNVRELRNAIERTVALCPGETVELHDLSDPIRLCGEFADGAGKTPVPATSNQLDTAKKDAERQRLVEALSNHNNNRTIAATELGISRVTLYKKLRQYRLL